MSLHRYRAWNSAMVTTLAIAGVATANGVKTMLQLATPSIREIEVISWGFSMSGTGSGTVELLQTDVAATVTAHVASGLQPVDPNLPPSQLTIGSTTATGFTATVEGSVAATRSFDANQGLVSSSTYDYNYQFLPDERPIVPISKFLRVRTSFTTTGVTLLCWICWGE